MVHEVDAGTYGLVFDCRKARHVARPATRVIADRVVAATRELADAARFDLGGSRDAHRQHGALCAARRLECKRRAFLRQVQAIAFAARQETNRLVQLPLVSIETQTKRCRRRHDPSAGATCFRAIAEACAPASCGASNPTAAHAHERRPQGMVRPRPESCFIGAGQAGTVPAQKCADLCSARRLCGVRNSNTSFGSSGMRKRCSNAHQSKSGMT